jgi:hypothetical protein
MSDDKEVSEVYLIEGKFKEDSEAKWLPLQFYYNSTVARDRLREMDIKKHDYRLTFARITRLEVIETHKG